MPFPAIPGLLAAAAPYAAQGLAAAKAGGIAALPFLQAAAQNPIGQYAAIRGAGALGGGLQRGIGGLYNRMFGTRQQMPSGPSDPFAQEHMMAQQELLGQMRQPITGANFDPIRQQALRSFEQQTLPGIQSQFGGIGADSGYYQHAVNQARGDLELKLAALQAGLGSETSQLEQARQNALANYLAGQQQLGQSQFQFKKQFPLDVYKQGLRGLELGQQYRQMASPASGMERAMQLGLGRQMDPLRIKRRPGALESAAEGIPTLVESGMYGFGRGLKG